MSPEAKATPVRQGMFVSLRERLSRRSDSEHGQAFIRIVIANIGLLYVFFFDASGKLTADQHHVLYLVFFIFLASVIADKIIENLSKPFMLADKALFVTTSIGVATYPQDGADASVLIHSADSAMYEAKRNGKNGYRIFRSKHMPFVPASINGLAR